jgi:hypothetical protein
VYSDLPKSLQVVYWFLFLSYVLVSPAMIVVEYREHFVSERFGYVPEFIYLVAAVQVLCALLLLSRALAIWSLVILTVLSAGAVWSHISIASPLTGLPALAYTALQIWLGIYVYRDVGGRGL